MREARIIAPMLDNQRRQTDNHQAAVNELQAALLEHFGGVTRTQGEGLWRHPVTHETQAEPVLIFDVATSVFEARNENTLIGIAERFGRATGQYEVYLRFPSGDVMMVPTAPIGVDTGIELVSMDDPAKMHASIAAAIGE